MPAKHPFVTKDQLVSIAERYPTPFHLYDEAGIRANVEAVLDAFSWNLGFKEYFAVKANPNPRLISILAEYGCGCDCSSDTELMICDALGIRGSNRPQKIVPFLVVAVLAVAFDLVQVVGMFLERGLFGVTFDVIFDLLFMGVCVYLAVRVMRQPTPEELAAAAGVALVSGAEDA